MDMYRRGVRTKVPRSFAIGNQPRLVAADRGNSNRVSRENPSTFLQTARISIAKQDRILPNVQNNDLH